MFNFFKNFGGCFILFWSLASFGEAGKSNLQRLIDKSNKHRVQRSLNLDDFELKGFGDLAFYKAYVKSIEDKKTKEYTSFLVSADSMKTVGNLEFELEKFKKLRDLTFLFYKTQSVIRSSVGEKKFAVTKETLASYRYEYAARYFIALGINFYVEFDPEYPVVIYRIDPSDGASALAARARQVFDKLGVSFGFYPSPQIAKYVHGKKTIFLGEQVLADYQPGSFMEVHELLHAANKVQSNPQAMNYVVPQGLNVKTPGFILPGGREDIYARVQSFDEVVANLSHMKLYLDQVHGNIGASEFVRLVDDTVVTYYMAQRNKAVLRDAWKVLNEPSYRKHKGSRFILSQKTKGVNSIQLLVKGDEGSYVVGGLFKAKDINGKQSFSQTLESLFSENELYIKKIEQIITVLAEGESFNTDKVRAVFSFNLKGVL